MHRPVKHILMVLICGVFIIGTSVAGFSRVFWKRRAETPSEILRLSRGWNRLLTSRIGINNGSGNLEILGYEGDLDLALRMIRNSLPLHEGGEFDCTRAGNMVYRLVETDTGVLRIIAVEGMLADGTVVFMLEQTLNEYQESLSSTGDHKLKAVPAYPGSIAKCFVRIDKTRAQLEVSKTLASPQAVSSFFLSAMPSAGWRHLSPFSIDSSRAPGAIVFQKGSELCCLLVQYSESAQASMIAVLHKQVGN